MESPAIMGEAGDIVTTEKSKNTEGDVGVNGDLSSSCDEPMEICEKDSKAPEENSNDIDSSKNCEKVPTSNVPADDEIDTKDDESMDVELSPHEVEGSDAENEQIEQSSNKDESELDAEEEKTESRNTVQDETSEDENHESMSSPKPESNSIDSVTNGTSSSPVHNVNGTNSEPFTVKSDDETEAETEIDQEQDEDDGVVVLNDSGDVVLVEHDSEHKENGEVCSSPDVEEVINLSDKDNTANSSSEIVNLVSPAKSKKKKPIDKLDTSLPPRRSSRNLNKNKSYVEKEDDPDVEEVTEVDPLADPLRDDKENKKKHVLTTSSSTIVVSDTKRLVEIAANSKTTGSSGKKEPTLVIIDTNSILSGRGPVPVSLSHKSTPITTSFSMMPVALPAQGVYPPNMRATITPIPMSSSQATAKASPAPAPTPAAPILPTLTDDMYVVEAPSFIVPYVYEKPPLKPFKEFVTQIGKEVADNKKIKDDKDKKNKEDKEESEKSDNTPKKDKDSEDEAEDEEEDDAKVKRKKDEEKEETKDEDNSDDEKKNVIESKESEEDKNNAVSSKENNMKTINLDDIPDEKNDDKADDKTDSAKPKSTSYFDNALGQFFINIGYGLVQEFVQTDLLKQQKRKQNREGSGPESKIAINSLIKNLEYSKENNEPYKMEQKKCEFCSFKTESQLVLAHHLETPHMRNYVYKCNFCPLEVRSPHDILFHMEAEHNTRGRLERAPAFHHCSNCPFEDNQKGKLSRHLVTCVKKFKPDRNLEPPADWEPPAKIPRVPKIKQQGLSATAATYQALAQSKGNYQLFSKLQQASQSAQVFPRGRGRPSLMGKVSTIRTQLPIIRTNMMYRPSTSGSGSVLVPTTYQFGGNQIFQVVGGQSELGSRLSVSGSTAAQGTVTIQNSSGTKNNSGKVVQQPSISITPLPRQPAGSSSSTISKSTGAAAGESSSKATFVICEICDGYIKDLEQLRNHMQWIHKVKIHPKMIYNRPPLNCQKCQFRFFTDQGLERHLLGSHGLVTSSMQEAANKSKDAGRCPVCGRVYQWKLLNHVARDHNMTLKPAHLSYKCTVCTATFGMYKQFENHVYSAHSVVAKRVMEKKGSSTGSGSTTSRSNDSLLKPLKINDEITIIPQPAKSKTNSTTTSTRSSAVTGDRVK